MDFKRIALIIILIACGVIITFTGVDMITKVITWAVCAIGAFEVFVTTPKKQ